MTTTTQQNQTATESILTRAMLVDLRISAWEARKHDAQVTEETNEEHLADRDAGRYHKHLFGGKAASHQAVLKAARGLRVIHNTQTLPWGENAVRLLPTANYFEYTEAMRRGKARFDAALDKFLADYDRLREEAKTRLGSMYRDEDYPAVWDVRRRFSFSIEYSPLPSGGDFRVTLPAEELAVMAKQVEDRVSTQVRSAAEDAWKRLQEAVETIKGRLDADGKFLRQSTIDRLRDLSDVLGRLNVMQDPKLDEMRQRVVEDLGMADADTLRDDEKVRQDAAKKVADILTSMQGLYGAAQA